MNINIMKEEYRYDAFISYSWKDEKWAKWIQDKLELFHPSVKLRKQYPKVPQKIKIFRDKTDMRIGTTKRVLQEELKKSRYLIVVCSPNAVLSAWVTQEIEYFISIGREEEILLLIVAGIPYTDLEKAECIPEIIRCNLPERFGANVHEQGKEWPLVKREKAFVRIFCKLFDVYFDFIWNRCRRKLIHKWILYVFIFVCFLGTVCYIWWANYPFDVRIKTYETTIHNANLPFRNGTLSLIIAGDTLVRSLQYDEETADFPHVAGKFRKCWVQILFEMEGYHKLDTTMRLKPDMVIPLRRNNAYGKVYGYIRDANTDQFLEGVGIEIADQKAWTDKNGYFVLHVPLALQKVRYDALLVYRNKTSKIYEGVYPALNDDSTRFNTLYLKSL